MSISQQSMWKVVKKTKKKTKTRSRTRNGDDDETLSMSLETPSFSSTSSHKKHAHKHKHAKHGRANNNSHANANVNYDGDSNTSHTHTHTHANAHFQMPCRHFQRGYCRMGDRCKYAHDNNSMWAINHTHTHTHMHTHHSHTHQKTTLFSVVKCTVLWLYCVVVLIRVIGLHVCTHSCNIWLFLSHQRTHIRTHTHMHILRSKSSKRKKKSKRTSPARRCTCMFVTIVCGRCVFFVRVLCVMYVWYVFSFWPISCIAMVLLFVLMSSETYVCSLCVQFHNRIHLQK